MQENRVVKTASQLPMHPTQSLKPIIYKFGLDKSPEILEEDHTSRSI